MGGLPLLLDDGEHSYIYGASSTPLAQVDDVTGAVQYLHADLLGTPRLVTDSAGSQVGTVTFDAFGTVASQSGVQSSFGFTGNWTDQDTGLLYLRARDYDPLTGQFLTADQLVDQTRQPYAYVGNNPVTRVDPRGLAQCEIDDTACIVGALHASDADRPLDNAMYDFWSSPSGTNVSSLFAGITDVTTLGGTALLRDAVAPGWNACYQENGFYTFGAVWGIAATLGLGGSGALSASIRSSRAPAPLSQFQALVPVGSTLKTWGGPIWGVGPAGAQALIGTRGIAELRQLGLTVAEVTTLRDFYYGAMIAGRGGATAGIRVELLESILKTLISRGLF